ncbi:MAG: phenylalanine--tRNA ligase subunit alpha [bacterium]|nr:phenylalanine--tRNA ligase subunit alpha [bacterium]
MLSEKELEGISEQFKKEIEKIDSEKTLNEIFNRYLGKKGEITCFFGLIKDLPPKDKQKFGAKLNTLKKDFLEILEKESEKIKEKFNSEKLEKESFDVSAPGHKITKGHLHPVTLVRREVEQIFRGMGFESIEGPEVETEWYNFDSLNVPKDHPARDMWDTFWIKDNNGQKNLLRTHTSPVQVRYMEKHLPPIKIIVPGRAYRHEATDASHEFQFHQVEGLMIDENINVANLKAILLNFFRKFFKKDVEIRLRPSFFPFTEPSFEIDISCMVCEGKGCSACKKTGWVELGGAGIVHPNVLKASGLNPKLWQGFAFGMGMDRLVMMKYKINHIKWFNSSDLRFLKQF